MLMTIRVDIMKSKEQEKYKQLEKLQQALLKANDSDLIPFEIRNGDELFGIFKSVQRGLDQLERLISLKQLGLYIGIGFGNAQGEGSHLINGPSIWFASDALEHSKQVKTNSLNIISSSIHLTYFGPQHQKTINLLFYYWVQNILTRTARQQAAIDLRVKYPLESDANLFLKLDPLADPNKTENNRVNFSRTLTRAQYNLFLETSECLNNLIGEEA